MVSLPLSLGALSVGEPGFYIGWTIIQTVSQFAKPQLRKFNKQALQLASHLTGKVPPAAKPCRRCRFCWDTPLWTLYANSKLELAALLLQTAQNCDCYELGRTRGEER